MLTKSVLLSSFAALALASAAANPAEPRVTTAPVRRGAGDIGDDIDDLIDGAGSKAGDIADGAKTKAGDLIDQASSLVGDDVTKLGACASAAQKIDGLPPTPTGDLASAFVSGIEAKETDLCKAGDDLPEDLQEDWEDYKSEASKWYSDNSAAVKSAIDACPTALELEKFVKSADCITGEDGEGAAARFTGAAAAVAGVAVGAVAVLL